MRSVIEGVLVGMVLVGATVLVVGCYQFALAGLNALRRPYRRAGPFFPRVAVVIPAWNEAAVVARTLDRLMDMAYPADRLRAYVVDDASTDETPAVLEAKVAEHPGRIVHLRRDRGGEGKSHTINHGLLRIIDEGWYEAVLIIDADVLFTRTALRRMTRHLADPGIGAVTSYIKEGSDPPNYLNRFVAFEYVTAQAAARRAQNVLGAQACLAGGAQLIRREALEAVGGQIDSTTLAEDTVTTFRIQLAQYRVVFEGNAVVWAEEPGSISALWRQRVRWARGNVQVTRRYSWVWLRRWVAGALGGLSFSAIWFSVTLMPLFLISASTGLITLLIIDRHLAVTAFVWLWGLTAFTYLFVTLSSLAVDRQVARRAWFEGVMFPGAISLALIAYGLGAPVVANLTGTDFRQWGLFKATPATDVLLIFADLWLTLSMLAAYLLKRLESWGRLRALVGPLLYVVGYGPLLCAITFNAYVAELRHREQVWEKTEKSGRVGEFA